MQDEEVRFLEPPYQLYDPPQDAWVEIPVVRWQAGLMQVPKRLEAGTVIKPGIRFYLPGGGLAGLRPYLDMTHRLLLQRFFRAWRELVAAVDAGDLRLRLEVAARLDPETRVPLRVRILRRGAHPDSSYELEVVRDWGGGR